MARDETDETVEEEFTPRTRTARPRPADADEAEGTSSETRTRARPRPTPGRSAEEEEPEPLVTPGSFSRTLGHIALVVLALAVLYTAWQHTRRDNEEDAGEPRAGAEERDGDTIPEEEPQVTTTLAEPGEAVEPDCPPDDGASEPVRAFTGPPPTCIDLDGTYVATIETSRGDFEITLDTATAPRIVNNFVFLARWGFYEGAGFHRVEPDFVMDTGDPIGRPDPGYGGPGYTLDTEPPPAGAPAYQVMSVTTVMTPEGRINGSQFSIMTGTVAIDTANELAPQLRPTVFGQVTSGEDVVQEIDATGDELTGLPMEPTVIEGITIDER